MHELQIETSRNAHTLNLLLWDKDSGYIHTVWRLCEVYNSELNFGGGRFRRYKNDVRENQVSFSITRDSPRKKFQGILEWLAENVENPWSIDFSHGDPVMIGGGMSPTCVEITLKLCFEDEEDAVLCRLSLN